jgi:hypothetical protein
VLAIGAVGAASAVALLLSADGSSPRRGASTAITQSGPSDNRGTPLHDVPTAIKSACARTASHAAFPVLCPARWPSPGGRDAPKARLFEKASDEYLIDAENGFRRDGGHVFHLLVGGQRQAFGRWPAGVDPDLRLTTRKVTSPQRGGGTFVQQLPARRIATARVHGAPATVLREPPYPAGGLHGGHVVVLWSEDGRGYLVSVHGERLSQLALVSTALAIAQSTSRTQENVH